MGLPQRDTRDLELLRKLERNKLDQSAPIIKDWGSFTKQATHVSILKLGKKLNDSFRSELEEEHKRDIELLEERYRILRKKDQEDSKNEINAAYIAQESKFEERAAEIRLECEQEMQKLRTNLQEQIASAVEAKTAQFQTELNLKLKEQKESSDKEFENEKERIKYEQLELHKEALQLVKSENMSKMNNFLGMIRQTKADLNLLKHQSQKDSAVFKAQFEDATESLRENFLEVLSQQASAFEADKKDRQRKVEQLEAELKKSLREQERTIQVCRCLEAERDSLRKYYKEFVLLTRPDLLQEQSDFVFPWNYATAQSSCASSLSYNKET